MKSRPGFTLLELLLVVGILAILVAIVIVALDPTKQRSEVRDEQREHDVEILMNALYEYAVDHDGVFPTELPSEPTEICAGETEDCSGMVDLSVLVPDYLESIPRDPQTAPSEDGTEYVLYRNGRKITISALNTERVGEVIEEVR